MPRPPAEPARASCAADRGSPLSDCRRFLSCRPIRRSAAPRRARAPAGSAGVHQHRTGPVDRHLRSLGVRGHSAQGREVRRDGIDDPSDQTQLRARAAVRSGPLWHAQCRWQRVCRQARRSEGETRGASSERASIGRRGQSSGRDETRNSSRTGESGKHLGVLTSLSLKRNHGRIGL